jgi:hypothetical protein
MSTPQGPSTPQGTPPGEPAEQPAWGQQPPGGWGQAQQDVELDPDETGAVPTQSAPEHDPPPKPAEFDKSRQQQQQQTETLPAMPPLGRPPHQPPAPPPPSQAGQPPQAGPGGPGPKLPQLPQHGLPQMGQPTAGVPLFGQGPQPGQPPPYGQPSFGRPQQGPGQQYGQPGPGPAPFGSPGWGLSQQPTQQFPGQPQVAPQRGPQGGPQAPEQRGGVKRLLPIVLGGVAVVALVALLGFVTPGFFVTRVFDPVALQSGVQHVLTQNYHMDVAGVRCEEGIRVDEGTRFECDATVDGASVKVPIIVTGSDGSYEVGRPS